MDFLYHSTLGLRVIKKKKRRPPLIAHHGFSDITRKVDVRLPGKRNSNSHGARPIRLIITMIKWTRSSRLSIKNSLSPIS